jgi:hypothetical protein
MFVGGFVAEHIELGGPQVVARDGPRVVGWDIVPWWHHTLRHCRALGMGSLTGYRGRGLGKAFLGAGLERAVQARVDTGGTQGPRRQPACARSVKTSMPQTGRAEEQTRRVQIFAAFDLVEY